MSKWILSGKQGFYYSDEGQREKTRKRSRLYKTVIVNGNRYPTARAASQELNVSEKVVLTRCRSSNHPGWWIEQIPSLPYPPKH